MADNPVEGWGCIDLPLIGPTCASDLFNGQDPVFQVNVGGNGTVAPPVVSNGTFVPPGAVGGTSVAGCQVSVPVQMRSRAYAPPGYVITYPDGRGTAPVAMLKEVAIKCRLWKRPSRPMMTASEAKTLRKAARLTKKVDRIAKMSNAVCSQAPLRRVRRGR